MTTDTSTSSTTDTPVDAGTSSADMSTESVAAPGVATQPETVDVVVVGTGAAAFSAALTAADKGLRVVMLESTNRWGGSSAMSGGGLWLPANPLMAREGAADSREDALRYLDETVGNDAGPAASPERRAAFVAGVASTVETLERLGLTFVRAAAYPDYYPEKPGGKIGRSIELEPFDRKRVGDWWASSRGQDGVPAPMENGDFYLLQRAWSTPDGFLRGATVARRVATMLVKNQRLVGMGAALLAAMLEAALRLGVQVRLNAPVSELLVEGDRVVGVRTDGPFATTVRARRGVMLGSGGFDHNTAWRQTYQGVDGSWSSGSKGNLGSPIALAQEIGAQLDLMDDAWWGGSVPSPDGKANAAFMVSERSVPHSIIVDAQGRRFVNESESYVDLGHHMLSRPVDGAFWLVADTQHARRYLRSYMMDPRIVKEYKRRGILHKAETLTGLAAEIDIDPAVLAATVERFNGFCRTGIDQDFHRGDSAYDRYYGDPSCKPNPNLGTLEKGPFTAIQIVPGDLGTKGGVVTDVHARALRADGSVIEGLYAAGNCSASVMGHTYPGPGSTLGPAAVFGHLAAMHMCGALADRDAARVTNGEEATA